MQPKVTVVIAEHINIHRIGMKTFFSSEKSCIDVVGEAEDGLKLMSLLRNTSPDIVLMEISLRMKPCLSVLQEIKKLYPGIKIIILFDDNNHRDSITKAMQAGANGYIKKTYSCEKFCKVVMDVSRETFHPNDFLDEIPGSLQKRQQGDLPNSVVLTEQETLVLKLMSEEKSTKEIADILDFSPRTIEAIRDKLKTKTGTKSMAGLVMFAIKNGLTEIPV